MMMQMYVCISQQKPWRPEESARKELPTWNSMFSRRIFHKIQAKKTLNEEKLR